MLLVFNIIISLSILLIVSNMMGKLVLKSLKWDLNFNIPMGYFALLSISQLLLIPLVFMGVSSTFYQITLFATILLVMIGLYFYNKDSLSVKQLFIFVNEGSKRYKVLMIGGVLLLSVILYIFMMSDYRIDRMSDSSFYIPMIHENINTDSIYSINPWSGIKESYSSLYRYVSYELFHASLINVFKIMPIIYINHVLVFINMLMIVMCNVELSMKLFKNKNLKFLVFIGYIFTVFCFITQIEDGYFFFFSTDMLQRLPYSGKVLAYLAVTPMFYLITKEIFNHMNRKRLLWGLLLINITATALTATAVFVFGIFYFGLILIRLYKKDEYHVTLGYCLTTAPLILHVILIKFSLLFIPVAIVYFVLLLVYFRQFNVEKMMIVLKYVLYTAIILIPIISVLVNFLDFIDKVESIHVLLFIKKILQTLNVRTILVWIFVTLGIYHVIKNDQVETVDKYLFGYTPLIIFIVFINPISSAFISSFLTTNFVYQRLFYIIPLLPLMGYGTIFVCEKYIIRTEYDKILMFLSLVILMNFWNPLKFSWQEVEYRLKSQEFNYKYMLNSHSVETTEFFKNLGKPIRLAHYFKENKWGSELRYIREIAPNVILPYNMYTHRYIVENNLFTEETYQQYQLHLLLNNSAWVYDYYVDFYGEVTDVVNYEFALDYLHENYDYVFLPKETQELCHILEGFGAKRVYETEIEVAYDVSTLVH